MNFRQHIDTWKDGTAMLMRLVPISLTGCMIAWTVFVCPYTDRSDVWAALMVLAFLPAVAVAHLALIAADSKRAECVLYAIVHVPMFTWAMFYCLILIGKTL